MAAKIVSGLARSVGSLIPGWLPSSSHLPDDHQNEAAPILPKPILKRSNSTNSSRPVAKRVHFDNGRHELPFSPPLDDSDSGSSTDESNSDRSDDSDDSDSSNRSDSSDDSTIEEPSNIALTPMPMPSATADHVLLPPCDSTDSGRSVTISPILKRFKEAVLNVESILPISMSEEARKSATIQYLINVDVVMESIKELGPKFQSTVSCNTLFTYQSKAKFSESVAVDCGRVKLYDFLSELMDTINSCKSLVNSKWTAAAAASTNECAAIVMREIFLELKHLHPFVIAHTDQSPIIHITNVKPFAHKDMTVNIKDVITFLYGLHRLMQVESNSQSI